ncbi:alpha/beta hydrolase [Kitasatospora sp. GP82]|uniref:alpha/beta hydrolase n=1 Tax=Kitasatospora sp. GP82 TaxID=3035089 RepID=UPI002473A289|nr:alpha/beta hydrolase [Kitasatospora sp. GP82]MDH6124552.1 pimeloyl-ACP methyl ester carboxylesterase [Kitasatospora sp. GP82]
MRAVRSTRFLPAAVPATVAAAALLLAGCSSGAGTSAPNAGGLSSANADGGQARVATPLGALPPEIPADLNPYYTQKLTWQSCDEEFECTTFKVPLDYGNPAGGDMTLSAVRKTATGGTTRLGSLLLNPGGPGGSAIEYLENVATGFDSGVRAAYDLVGLDPRGVGRSSPVTCLSGAQMDAYTAVDTSPDNQSEVDALVAADKEFAAGCQQHAGSLLGHVSSQESARDMDVLRAVLGDDKLHYLGKSYGTYLGSIYAGLYPGRVGKMVLDGAMDPSLDSLAGNRAQAGGFETAWAAFAKDCITHDDCPVGTTEKQVGDELDALLKRIDAQPLPTDSGRKLTESLATAAVIQAMYADFLWPQLRTALTTAKAGNGTALLKLSDSYFQRTADGNYLNLMYANMAVNCLDLPAPFAGPADVERVVPEFQKTSPHFGRDMAWMALSCTYWPIKPTGEPHTIRAAGAAPIVVVGTTRDPATPYLWAQAVTSQLESGHLLTYDGDGHTAYGRHNECIDGAVNSYLLGGQAPSTGTRCAK